MGLFTPGWKKDPDKAKNALKTKSVNKLQKIAMQADFPDPQGLSIRYDAVHAIRFIDGLARYAVQSLKWLYQKVPESHSMLAFLKGRSFKKHDDYYDSNCGGNNRNQEVTVTVNLD